MRYDFGAVYKSIRESKGLTQGDVCGDMLSRTSLSKIESGKTLPRYENMEFLLRQINMSFEEFDYICHLYQPNERTLIYQKLQTIMSISGSKELQDLLDQCQDYLKKEHDYPIQQFEEMLKIVIHIREKGWTDFPEQLQQIIDKIWDQIEKQDDWYESDFKLLNTILFHIPLDRVHLLTDRLLRRLDDYKGYRHVSDMSLSLLSNLSTLYFYHKEWEACLHILDRLSQAAKDAKQYDVLALSQVRKGICQHQPELIQQGLDLLTLAQEEKLLADLKEEVQQFYNP